MIPTRNRVQARLRMAERRRIATGEKATENRGHEDSNSIASTSASDQSSDTAGSDSLVNSEGRHSPWILTEISYRESLQTPSN